MKNLVLAVIMETIYQAILRDAPGVTRLYCYRRTGFNELCWLALCDPKAATSRFFP